MTIGRILTGLLIAAIFGIGAKRYWGRTIGAGPTIINVGLVFLLAFAGYNYAVDQAADKAAAAMYRNAVDDYNTCIAKVDRSAGSRKYNLKVQAVFAQAFGKSAAPFLEILRLELDADLPALLYKTCPPPPGYTIADIPEGP